MESKLSVESMTKDEMPSPSTGRMMFRSTLRFSFRSLRMVLGPVRNFNIQQAPTA